jgi:mono/diheme cytochrome c family protein
MRERWARYVAVLTGLCMLGLAYWFAVEQDAARRAAMQSQPAPPVSRPAVADNVLQFDRGKTLFAEQQCDTCHSIAGLGHPSYPLDGIGQRLDSAAIRERITAQGEGASVLSPRIVGRKARYQDLSDDDLAALVAYLSQQPATR